LRHPDGDIYLELWYDCIHVPEPGLPSKTRVAAIHVGIWISYSEGACNQHRVRYKVLHEVIGHHVHHRRHYYPRNRDGCQGDLAVCLTCEDEASIRQSDGVCEVRDSVARRLNKHS